jgi:hypothetical protein
MEKDKVFCGSCGKECIPEGMTTGYGKTASGEIRCFICCAADDKAQMDRDGKIALYLTLDPTACAGGKVTNWPGTLSFYCTVKCGKHNIARTRYDVWFKDHNGNRWHGVQYGDNTQICHCHKLTKRGK